MLLGLTAAVVLASIASASSWVSFTTDGVRIQHPANWHATADPPTPVTYPKQVLVAASFPIPKDTAANGCRPTGLLTRKQPNGAVIFVIEYGQGKRSAFPPRHMHSWLGAFGNYECYGRSYQVRFRQAGRYFQIFASFGRHATPALRSTVLRIVESFVAKPR